MALKALYIHVPFCKRRCAYCDFSSSVAKFGDTRAFAYTQKLLGFIEDVKRLGVLEELETAYIGGGTPTMLGADLLGELIARVNSCASLTELSFEANPDSLEPKLIKVSRSSGATRASIGVQSFVDLELKALARVHTSDAAMRAVKSASKAGLAVSIDLMCGIPYQNIQSWHYSLKRALELSPNHISVYPLMIEEGTLMERQCEAGDLPWPSDDAQADYMELAEALLSKAGYKRYEVASYAKPGFACKHNQTYWTGKEYLGLGWSAASMMRRQTYNALKRLLPQLPALKADTSRIRLTCISGIDEIVGTATLADLHFNIEEMSVREAVAEDLMLGARMSIGISDELVAQACELCGYERTNQTLADLLSRGLLTYNEGRYQPTHTGWLLGNELYGALWDLA